MHANYLFIIYMCIKVQHLSDFSFLHACIAGIFFTFQERGGRRSTEKHALDLNNIFLCKSCHIHMYMY